MDTEEEPADAHFDHHLPTLSPPDDHTPDQDNTEDDSRSDEFYAILNLPKTVSTEDIIRRYKQLATLLHPDRHTDPLLKSAADSRFQAVSRAYETLSNPTTRMVYDTLGEEGLKTSWELGKKYKTPAELRAEFERLGRKSREEEIENLVRSRGDLTCTLDTRVIMLTAEERIALGGPKRMTLSQKIDSITTKQLVLKHSFTLPVDSRTSLVLTGQLLTREGVGAGNLFMKLNHRPNSKLSFEIGTTVLRPRAITFKTTFAPDPDSFITVDFPIKTLAIPPPLSMTIGRRISTSNTATFSIRTGIYSLFGWGRSSLEPISSSTVSLGLINNSGWSVDASSGVQSSTLSANYSIVLRSLGGIKCTTGVTFTSFGAFSTYAGGEGKVSENVRVGGNLEVGMNGRMTLKLRISRLGQKLVVPIIISSTLNPTLVVVFTVVPAVSMIVSNHYIIVPRRKKRVLSRIQKLREENVEYLLAKKTEAEDAVKLLIDFVQKKREIEVASNGLIILEANYGVLSSTSPSDSSSESQSRSIDVVIPLQSLVNASSLLIPSGTSKASLLGFYDPAISEKKRLEIRYRFKGREHYVVVDDRGGVALPLRAHLVD